ncbi:hypothetical protein K1T71_002816 [Dendrolimus kikuchii]|uniref:Uncharacterized protein n=1 Tax=Dendrolimus kikuchii TaxID=765133 RepID=A0ACC1DEB1_9NEOP|nr:hypothetical protein K1T71_002816 [Dendrolimus kikuchii]
MFLWIFIYFIFIVASAFCKDKDFGADLLTRVLLESSSSESTDSRDDDSWERSREMKKYHKYIAKLDQKRYKEAFKQMMSQEEKDEVKHYENILSAIKAMNSKSPRRRGFNV